MSEQKGNTLLNNLIFVLLIGLLILGAYKSNPDLFSTAAIKTETKHQQAEKHKVKEKNNYNETSIFDKVQEERVRQKIDYGTAMEYFNSRSLSGTEIMELEKRSETSAHFVRNSTKKLIFYPTTGSSKDAQNFMRDFTKFRTSMKNNSNLVFIPVETGFGISEKQIKNSSDRVFYNLKKECGRFCVMDASKRTIVTLKSPQIGAKTFEIVEALINSL